MNLSICDIIFKKDKKYIYVSDFKINNTLEYKIMIFDYNFLIVYIMISLW